MADAAVETGTLDLGDVRLAYRSAGPPGGTPLVLLHALGESAADWDELMPAFAARRRVHALDLRGHGGSSWPGPGRYGLERMCDDVLRAVDGLGVAAPADLLGHSLGGMVAHLCAQHRPDRWRRLVLEDIGAPLPRDPVAPQRPDGNLGFDWDMVLDVRAQIDRPDPAWLDGLGRVMARTLVVGGGPDSHVPQERVADLARRVPDARLVTLPVGHLVHRAAPDRFTREVLAFLDE